MNFGFGKIAGSALHLKNYFEELICDEELNCMKDYIKVKITKIARKFTVKGD